MNRYKYREKKELNENDLISVIVPIYKVEDYLTFCINSIIDQTYTNIEIILVDDGSPDSCPEICDFFKSIDKRIIVIHKKNGGLSSARNAGLEACKGKYVCFVDSDDYIHKNYIELLYNSIIISSSDIIVCNYQKTFNHNNIKIQRKKDLLFIDNFEPKEAILEYSKRGNATFVVAWNKLYSRCLFDDIKFPEGKLAEDNYIMYKLFLKSKTISYINIKLYYYFNNKKGIMNTNNDVSRFNVEALEQFLIFSKPYTDCASYRILRENSVLKSLDYITDDYWKYYLNKDTNNAAQMIIRYNNIIKGINTKETNIGIKLKLFNFNKPLFIFVRSTYDYLSNFKTVIFDLLK